MTREQFIDQYLDKYEQAHPDKRIDYDKLREEADCAWYDREVDKNVKAWRKGLNGAKSQAAVDAYGKTHVKRERKPNEVKRQVMTFLHDALRINSGCVPLAPDAVLTNPERQIDFTIGGKSYTLTLTEHRAPKPKA